MRNIALKLMYNGTAYHGWQVQKNAVTVCGTLEKAIADICGGPVHLTGCGRTDAGVHAEHYIANFRTESRIPVDRLPFAVNTHTPEDIAVKEAFEVAEDFNAIGSCLRQGDSVVLDLFMPIRRYWCDMTRTVFFGQADEEQKRVYEVVRQANLAAEQVLRPGVPLCQVDQAARKIIEEAGYGPFFTHRLGHGCGLECHEPPDNSSVSQAIAQPGMVFSVEPGIYLPGRFGVRIEDLVLVTEDGCQVLNALSKDLRIV